jgi:peptide deformylase
MKIIEIPNPMLRTISQEVTEITGEIIEFIEKQEHTLIHKKNPEGVGLSAPQVGQNWRIFSTYLDRGGIRIIKTYINPTITKASSRLSLGPDPQKPFLEGCLSIPNIFAPVWRHQTIKLDFFTLDPASHKLIAGSTRFDSFPARVVQHEMDHLEGILFTDRTREQNLPVYEEIGEKLVETNKTI